jgi:hypothetical protein
MGVTLDGQRRGADSPKLLPVSDQYRIAPTAEVLIKHYCAGAPLPIAPSPNDTDEIRLQCRFVRGRLATTVTSPHALF